MFSYFLSLLTKIKKRKRRKIKVKVDLLFQSHVKKKKNHFIWTCCKMSLCIQNMTFHCFEMVLPF